MTADEIHSDGMEQTHQRTKLLAVALIVATCLAYFPAFQCGYIWEDDDYVTRNSTLQQGTEGLRRIWFELNATPQYYPLVHTTFWLEYQIWQLHPTGYHVTNVLLHMLTVILLWRLLERLKVPGAWLAALIFAVHPVHVDSVAWITERKNTLSAFFYLAAAHMYLRFDEDSKDSRRWYNYAFSLSLFLMSLLSKTVTTTLPAALLLVIWWKRGTVSRRDILSVLPFFALAIPMGLVTVLLEKEHVGTEKIDLGLAPIDRFLVAGRALWFYAGNLVWPNKLIFIYPRWEIDAGVWWQYLFPVFFLATLVTLWTARKTLGRGPITAVLFFAGTLVPALGFFDLFPMLYTFVMDHFQHLASIGIISLMASTFVTWRTYLGERHRLWMNVVAGTIVVILGWQTWSRCHVYKDEQTLFEDTVAKNPAAWMPHNNLGRIYAEKGRYNDALESLTLAIEHRPSFIDPNFVDIHFSRGVVYEGLGNFPNALDDYSRSIRQNPNQTKSYENRASVHLVLENYDLAMKDISVVLEPEAENHRALCIRARIHVVQGNLDLAEADLRKAGSLRPSSVDLLISDCLLRLWRFEPKAENYLQASIEYASPRRRVEVDSLIHQVKKRRPAHS